MGYRDSDDSHFSRHGMGRDLDDMRFAERGHAQGYGGDEPPRTGYRAEQDRRADHYDPYGMVRGRAYRDETPGRYAGQGRDPYVAYGLQAYPDLGRDSRPYENRWSGDDNRFDPAYRDAREHGGGGAYGFVGNAPPAHLTQDPRDPDYQQWRDEQLRLLDEDYDAWRKERYQKFSEDFSQWRSSRPARASGQQRQKGNATGAGASAQAASAKSKDPG